MEPTMINLKVLSSVAAIALVLPMAVPSDSFAQQFKGGGGGKGGVAVGGGALASSYPYYGYGSDYYDTGYYDTGYYDTGYYDDPGFYGDAAVVAAVPAPVGGDDAVAYCMQTYQSYDPASGTYLGYDG